MPEENDPPQSEQVPEQPTLLGNMDPGEMLARGMQSVRMTSGTAGTWEPPTVEEAARLFPSYEVIKLLGRGGMGAVYQAREMELDRLVAIKLLPLEVSVDKDFADRFRREARAMARLNHPNIITVHAFGTTREGHLYFVMEYVEGANLADLIHQVGLSGEQALSIVEQVCTALAYAHNKGIVHRDIKPANVMIDTESQVKVADFGLARLTDPSAEQMGHTMTGIVMGTPDYMAPEQMRGMNVDHRADIYSLGVMVYEMLCREVPRGAFEPPSVRSGCDARIDPIVIKAMQPDPERRYQSTQEMKTDVTAVRAPLPAPPSASPQPGVPKPLPRPPKPLAMKAVPPPAPKKSKTPLYVGIAALILAFGALVYFAPWKKDTTGGARSVVPQASTGEAGKSVGADEAAPFTATKDQPFVNSLGMKFVPVPETKVLFCIWDTRVQDYATYARSNRVNDTWTKEQKDNIPVSREPDYPVVGVDWDDAKAFCQWLTEKESAAGKLPPGMSYRLPTDEEWSRAAGLAAEKGATPEIRGQNDSVDFPWGLGFPPSKIKVGNYADAAFHEEFPTGPWIENYDDGYATTSPVGSYPPNQYGLYDMGGNVWQWCEDLFKPGSTERVLRGASWAFGTRSSLLSSYRAHTPPDRRANEGGFRCVLAPTLAAAVAVPATGTTPASATTDQPFENTLGMKFVPVPETKVLFSVWDTRVQDYAAYAGAKKVDDSWTNQQRDGVPAGRELNHPVVDMSWEDAQAFCQWLTEKEIAEGKLPKRLKYRLPTDEEWSWAVGLPPELGATPTEKSLKNKVDFPWGKEYPPRGKVGNYADETFHAKFPLKEDAKNYWDQNRWIEGYTDGYATTSPVGSFPANAYGLYDMGGNVWQWCEDWFDASHKDCVLRGASWNAYDRYNLLSSYRNHSIPGYRSPHDGFRCVLAPAAPEVNSTPATATKDAPFENTLGMKFVPVPIPTRSPNSDLPSPNVVLFSVWDTRMQDYAAYAGARKVDTAWTTQNREGVPAGREPNHPVVGVSWEDAQAFCQWLTEKEIAEGKLPKGLKYRLPTDEEWSGAVGLPTELGATPAEKTGKNSVDFPWGKDYPPTKKVGNYADETFHAKFSQNATGKTKDQPWIEGYDDGYATTSPVGSFPANAYGLYDMGGNVWQWCEDWFDDSHKDRVLRGASWGPYDRHGLLSSYRYHLIPGLRGTLAGFRCVLGVSAP